MPVETREAHIHDTLRTFVVERLKLGVAMTSKQDWLRFPDAPNTRFGYRPAMVLSRDDGTPSLAVPLCPELIAEQTEHLDDAELDQYLELLTFLIGRTAQYVADGDDSDTAVHKAEDELYESNASAMLFLSGVQASALED